MTRLSRPATFMGVLALIITGMAVITAVIPFRQIVEQRAFVESAAAELTRINLENEHLRSEVEALNTPGEIERLARENLGYVMPGEAAYVVLEPDEALPETITAPVVENGDRVPWYQAIWNFFTGADLSAG
jgi:cell division protein FtsB